MASSYTTHQGEMVDAICRRAYGDESGYVEMVLDANPGLAAKGSPLPKCEEVLLPNIPTALEVVRIQKLWD